MTELIHIAMYADLHCPYAYLSAYRLRQLRDEYRGRIIIEHKSLSLEYVNREPTPKQVLDQETPLLMLEEPGIPYQPWHRSLSEWPVTMWPAFEAVKCAERQSLELADELDWAIRTAFFAESRCISMWDVLFGLAEQVGVAIDRFADDFDRGVAKYQVLQEAQEGWERLKVEGSPTFVLPSGKQYSNVGLPQIMLDEKRYFRPVAVQPAPCTEKSALICIDDSLLKLFHRLAEPSRA